MKPEIIESGMFVKYIFYRKSDDKSNDKLDDKSGDNLKITTYIKMVTDYLKEHKEINISKTIKLLNLSKSRSNDILKAMQKVELLLGKVPQEQQNMC